jgi:hypothetical protein
MSSPQPVVRRQFTAGQPVYHRNWGLLPFPKGW